MDIEFVVQDAFALVRPQWKLALGLEEAGSAFADACKENYKSTGAAAPADADEHEELDDETEAGGRRTPVAEADKSSGDEAEVRAFATTYACAKHCMTKLLRRVVAKTSRKRQMRTPTKSSKSSSLVLRMSVLQKPKLILTVSLLR